MINQQTEFLICQYLDGELPDEERLGVEKLLAEDTEARKLLEEYRKLDGVLKQAPATPAVQWEMLAGRISGAIDEQERAEEARTAARWRIGWRMAIAASVLLAAGVSFELFRGHEPTLPGGGGNVSATVIAQVEGPQAEVASAPAVVEISIGAGREVADSTISVSSGTIAAGEPVAQDFDGPWQ